MFSSIVKQATRTADVIQVTKVILILLNLIAAVVGVVVAFLTRPTSPEFVVEGGYSSVQASGWGGWWVLGGVSVVQAIFGTLVIYVLLGWFECMLRTNTELVRQAELSNAVDSGVQ